MCGGRNGRFGQKKQPRTASDRWLCVAGPMTAMAKKNHKSHESSSLAPLAVCGGRNGRDPILDPWHLIFGTESLRN